jgi:ABC-type sugar transport system ATPase subunit
MDEPTRGIDVGAKVEIYKIINSLVQRGIGVILFSSEVPEICGMSDRIIVLFQGKMVKEVAHDQTNEIEIQRLVLSGR